MTNSFGIGDTCEADSGGIHAVVSGHCCVFAAVSSWLSVGTLPLLPMSKLCRHASQQTMIRLQNFVVIRAISSGKAVTYFGDYTFRVKANKPSASTFSNRCFAVRSSSAAHCVE
jgi:hypothetical protein